MPNGQDLRTLIDAFEAFFGFGDGFDGGNPKFLSARSVKGNANALPAVFHTEQGAGKRAAEAEILRTLGRFEKPVGFGRGKQIDDRLDADGDGFCESVLQFQADFAEPIAVGIESIINLLAPSESDRFFE